jgi:hypothetical protein
MKLALDANRYCDLCRGIAEVVEPTSQAERVYLPLIVLGETCPNCPNFEYHGRPLVVGHT